MKLLEFKKVKYWDKFIDLQKVNREYMQNEKDIKKYYTLKNSRNPSMFDLNYLKRKIIWVSKNKFQQQKAKKDILL